MSTLNYHRGGRGDPLVLIHGIGSRWQIWAPVLGGLEPHRDVIALDLPGFGASPMPAPGTPPGIDSLATLVGALFRELGLVRPHVAGNSLGGLVALELARRGMAASVTALSPAGFASRTEARFAHTSLRLSRALARRAAPRAGGLLRSRTGRRVAFSGTVAHPARMSPTDAAADLRGFVNAPWFDATLPTVGPMAFAGGAPIRVPVTIGWGAKDRLLLPRQARRAAREIPGARIVMLKDCGHVPTYDDPALVTQVLLDGSSGS